jgi:tetratricopeptide (TPR) repeat protein
MPPPDPPPADGPAIVVQVAARLLAEGRSGEAATRLEALAAAAPAYPAAHVLLARALEAEGRTDEALAAWHRAHFLVPNSPLVRRERQRLLEASPVPRASEAGAPPAEPVEAEPAAVEPDVPVPAAGAAMPGDLPDATPPSTVEEPGAWAGESEPGEAEREAGAGWHEPLRPSGSAGVEAEAARAATAPAPSPVEAQEAQRVEAEPERADEPAVVPPDMAEQPDEPVEDAPEREAGWWRRSAEPTSLEAEEDDEGWAVLEETEDGRPGSRPAGARVASPEEAALAAPLPGVEDAHVISAETGPEHPPAESRVEVPGSPPPAALADELDALIRQLEDAPRIRPDPTFRGPDVAFDEDIADDMVSETLARIYAAQRQYAEAAIVYEKLAQQRPEQSDELLRRAAEMRAQGEG